MSEKSQELLLGGSVEPPDRLDQDEDRIGDDLNNLAIYDSSVADILDNIGHVDFKFIYSDLISDIKNQTFNKKRNFAQNLLEKVSEVYDFEFPYIIEADTDFQIEQILLFIEFIEFDHIRFLSYVWKFLKQDLIKIDIWNYCQNNEMKIIKETEEQLETHPQIKLISIFLRTYYKAKFIEWFATNSEQSKVEIQIEIYESEGKLNG